MINEQFILYIGRKNQSNKTKPKVKCIKQAGACMAYSLHTNVTLKVENSSHTWGWGIGLEEMRHVVL